MVHSAARGERLAAFDGLEKLVAATRNPTTERSRGRARVRHGAGHRLRHAIDAGTTQCGFGAGGRGGSDGFGVFGAGGAGAGGVGSGTATGGFGAGGRGGGIVTGGSVPGGFGAIGLVGAGGVGGSGPGGFGAGEVGTGCAAGTSLGSAAVVVLLTRIDCGAVGEVESQAAATNATSNNTPARERRDMGSSLGVPPDHRVHGSIFGCSFAVFLNAAAQTRVRSR
jgi:hypothetical protein